ncbi:hypothetical protein PAPHI01_2219 [Pancytospora philotis]|nr:hypothetical protein PAPHI01_2219 [Pancytospora philotis]
MYSSLLLTVATVNASVSNPSVALPSSASQQTAQDCGYTDHESIMSIADELEQGIKDVPQDMDANHKELCKIFEEAKSTKKSDATFLEWVADLPARLDPMERSHDAFIYAVFDNSSLINEMLTIAYQYTDFIKGCLKKAQSDYTYKFVEPKEYSEFEEMGRREQVEELCIHAENFAADAVVLRKRLTSLCKNLHDQPLSEFSELHSARLAAYSKLFQIAAQLNRKIYDLAIRINDIYDNMRKFLRKSSTASSHGKDSIAKRSSDIKGELAAFYTTLRAIRDKFKTRISSRELSDHLAAIKLADRKEPQQISSSVNSEKKSITPSLIGDQADYADSNWQQIHDTCEALKAFGWASKNMPKNSATSAADNTTENN